LTKYERAVAKRPRLPWLALVAVVLVALGVVGTRALIDRQSAVVVPASAAPATSVPAVAPTDDRRACRMLDQVDDLGVAHLELVNA
jgi:hypothetical protein